ncbi:M1 family metallopeptidase [Rhodanobacter sp. OK091]|uniref:M1 family metallopeptidase n=1 Tax=Rhodanobacter sp. OK091 TaxID=1881037 RepID=UPI000916F574|nr:M1 family metallopeptidase [Rhodanobacter sp. OK091]SHM51641.1 Peptidase family M1 [Rhodanobacter sp. OK091]
MHHRLHLLAISVALGLAACTSVPVAKTGAPTQPALTAQTLNSGGVMPAEQARVHFDHAELHFTIDPAGQSIDASATLSFTAKSATDVLLLDLDRNLPIGGIALDDQPLAATRWSNPDGRLRIALPAPLASGGKVRVTIRYGGKPHVAKKAPWDGGFVWSHTADGQPWIASAVEGEGCDLFWPCIDHPQGEPDLVDTYVTVPKTLAAPGNGVLIGITEEGDRHTYHWRAKHPDTYAIAINVGPFDVLKADYPSRYGNTIPLEFWYLRGQEAQAKELFAGFPRMLDFFEQEIGPYPFGDEKMGVVETPYLGMEHQTLNAYGNDYKQDGYGFDRLLQHEFAHEWFGNQMTNADWDDMWLHEGFGTYMQPLYSQYLNGDADYFSWVHGLRLMLSNARPIVSGSSKTEEQVYDEKTGPGQDIYNKGALMLHTLRQLIGDKDFFESTRRLVYGRPDPKPGNFSPRYATTDEYIAIVDKVTGRDLHWFFDVYLHDAALPRLDMHHDGDTLALHWVTEHGKPFPMPVEVQVGEAVHTVPMTQGEGRLQVPAGSLLIVDPHSKLLRQLPHIDAFRQWMKQQRKAKSATH